MDVQISFKRRIVVFVLGIIAALFNLRCRFRAKRSSSSPPSAVLILEPYGMGDVISLEPLIRNLRRHNLRVRLSAQKWWQPLFPEEKISEWLPSEAPWTNYSARQKYQLSLYTAAPFRNYLRELRRVGRGAVGIDPRGDIRSVLLLYLAGCTKVLTLENYLGSDSRIPAFAADVTSYSNNLKRWEVNLLFLRRLGIDAQADYSPPKLDHFRRAAPPTHRPRAGLIPVAPWPGRMWEPDKWRQLIEILEGQGVELCGFCGPGQTLAAAKELGEKVSLVECGSVERWADELARLSFVITLDSGPMHLADALGIPVIALFGPGQLPLWSPSGEKSRVVSHQDDPDFFPCHQIEENIHLGQKFMRRITVREVVSAVNAMKETERRSQRYGTTCQSCGLQPTAKG